MILLEIDLHGIAIVKCECDAPWAVDMHGIADRPEALQGMKIETGDIHFLWHGSRIKTVEPDQYAPVQPRVDLRRVSAGPQIGQGLAQERPDHQK